MQKAAAIDIHQTPISALLFELQLPISEIGNCSSKASSEIGIWGVKASSYVHNILEQYVQAKYMSLSGIGALHKLSDTKHYPMPESWLW